jgi:hypothetical protein
LLRSYAGIPSRSTKVVRTALSHPEPSGRGVAERLEEELRQMVRDKLADAGLKDKAD